MGASMLTPAQMHTLLQQLPHTLARLCSYSCFSWASPSPVLHSGRRSPAESDARCIDFPDLDGHGSTAFADAKICAKSFSR